MNINKKTPTSIPPSTPPSTLLDFHKIENPNTPEIQNKKDNNWEKTDDKNLFNDKITLIEPSLSSIPQLSAIEFNTPTASQVTPNIGSIISYYKPGILEDLTKELKKIGIAKSRQKIGHKAVMKETYYYEIQINVKVKKKTT